MWSCGKFDAGGHIERMETENWVSKYRSLVNDDAAGGEDHARLGNKLCRTICKLCTWKKHLLKTMKDGEMPAPSYPC